MSDNSTHIASDDSTATSSRSAPVPPNSNTAGSYLGPIGKRVGLVILLVVCLVVFAATPFGRNQIVRMALTRVPLADGHSLTVDRTTGSLLAGLTLYSIQLTDRDQQVLASIDTVALDLDFLPLFSRTISLSHLDIRGPNVNAVQGESGSWNIGEAFAASPVPNDGDLDDDSSVSAANTNGVDDDSGFSIRIRSASIRNGSATASYNATTTDSVLSAKDILMSISSVSLGDKIEFDLQEMRGYFTPPGYTESVFVRTVASMNEGSVLLDTLIISSPRTNLRASAVGRLSLLDKNDTTKVALLDRFRDVRLSMLATPLSFADVAPFLGSIDATAEGMIKAEVTGSTRDVDFSLNADFGPNGSIEADGHSSISDTEVINLRLDGVIHSLRASLFSKIRFDQGDIIDGQLSANLTGPSQDQMTGDVRLTFPGTDAKSLGIARPEILAVFERGLAHYDASVVLSGQTIDAKGTVRPFDRIPTYDGIVSIAALDLSAFGGATADWPTNLTGTMEFSGSSFSTPQLHVQAILDHSTINSFDLEHATINSTLSADNVSADVTLSGRQGIASARMKVHSLNTSTWTLENLKASNLDVAALVGDTTTMILTGSAALSGTGWSLDAMDFSGTATIDSAQVNNVQIASFDLEAQKLGDTIRFKQTGLVDSARIQSRGIVSIGVTPGIYIEAGRISNLNIGQYVDGQFSDLNGEIEGRLTGASLRTMNGAVLINLTESTLNDTSVDSGKITATVTDGRIDLVADVSTVSGRLSLDGRFDPFRTFPSYDLHRSTFDAIDFGALSGNPNLGGKLTGTIEGSMVGESLATLRGNIDVHLEESVVNRIEGIAGTIKLSASDTLAGAYADLTWSGDGLVRVSIERRPSLDDSLDFHHSAALTIKHLDIGGWVGSDSIASDISTELQGNFAGRTFSDVTGNMRLVHLNGYYQELQISQGTGAFRIDNGILSVDRAILETSAGTLLANGTVALLNNEGAGKSNLALDANIKNLKPIGKLIPRFGALEGQGRLLAQITGPPESLLASATLHLDGIEYKNRRFSSIDATVDASFGSDRHLSMFDGTVDLLNIIMPTIVIRETTLHAALVDSVFQFEGISTMDERRSVQLSGVLDPRENVRSVLIDDLSIRVDQDRWELLQPSTITYGNGIRVKNLLLFTDDQQIALDGIVNLNGGQSLILTVENFRIAAIADLLNFRGLAGTANGYLDLTGPADAPIVEGDLSFDIESNQVAVGDMQLSLRYDSLLLYPDALFRHVDGSTLTIAGKLPIDLRLTKSQGPTQTGVRVAARQARPDTQVDLQIDADSFSLGWMLPFLDTEFYDQLDGHFDGQVQVFGTVRNPSLAGFAKITNGKIGLPAFGIAPDRITADIEFDGTEIRILHGEGKSGSGNVLAMGQINLSELSLGEFDISLSMENFLAMDNAQFRGATTSGDLLIYGTTKAPTVSGYLLMDALDIYYTGAIEEFEPVTLSEEDLRTVEQTFGRRVTTKDTTTFSFYDALQIDINLEMKRNTWLRSKQNPRMNIEFAGDMDFQKNSNEPERMFGTINVLPERSTIDQFGRRFDIEAGTVTYNGDFEDPIVDIAAKYTVKSPTDRSAEVEISLNARGSLQNLEIELNSDPQMELTDILSYVLTGRPAAQTLQFSSGGEAGLATDIALSQATGYLEGLAGSELGLDVVRIENNGSEIRLTAGKYVREGVYLAISQPVVLNSSSSGTSSGETNRPEFTVEVEIIRDLLARLLQQGSGFKLTLFWKHAY